MFQRGRESRNTGHKSISIKRVERIQSNAVNIENTDDSLSTRSVDEDGYHDLRLCVAVALNVSLEFRYIWNDDRLLLRHTRTNNAFRHLNLGASHFALEWTQDEPVRIV